MEVGNKDVYEYISNFADDKTVINMILANPKIFDKENFYEKVMRKRYPLLIEFRKENETWKALYLRMIYVLAKLQEDYQIPYIPTKGCNPEKLLYSKNMYEEALFCAAAGGNLPLIDYFLGKGAVNITVALKMASRYSDLNTIKYLLTKTANDYEDYGTILEAASAGGKIDTMKFALETLKNLEFMINDPFGRVSLALAINNGQIEAIDFLIENGITIRPINIERAEQARKYDIAAYLRKFV